MLRSVAATLAVAAVVVVATSVTAVPGTVDRPPGHDDVPAPAPAHERRRAGPALHGDFDGDGRGDIVWYGPGAEPDHHWYGRANGQFGGTPLVIEGVYEPLVGDFDGDGRSDVFWYAPGPTPDRLDFGAPGHGFAATEVSVDGTYSPFTGDFDGDGLGDIFWYGPGAGDDSIWYGAPGRTFVSVDIAMSRVYEPLVGDFDGDGRSDVFWHGPGTAPDALHHGTPDRSFAGSAIAMSRTYEPVVGDFDGDGRSDIFWYASGAATDVVHYGTPGRGFDGTAAAVDGDYHPLTGDFDGDGRSDILWYAAGTAPDAVHHGTPARGFDGTHLDVDGTYEPIVGDFDGSGLDDVVWYAPGPVDDYVWFHTPDRGIDQRPTTIDLDHPLAPPLQQHRVLEAYETYGYIAHAGGGHEGRTYTNSLEAVLHNHRRGFRVFELDFVVLADGTALAAHTGIERYYGLDKPFDQTTWDELAGVRFDGRYTVMRSDEVVQLLRKHPDVHVILDTKRQHEHVFRRFVEQTGGDRAVMDRLIPNIMNQDELDRFRSVYPLRNYIVALYRTQYAGRFDDPEVLRFVQDNRAPAVSMWWRDRDPAIRLGDNHFQQRRFTPAFAQQLQAAGAVVVGHSLNDSRHIARFESLGVSVYTDGPYADEPSATGLAPPVAAGEPLP
jgi:glycerophosphoryl diester phosphodiesterase